MCYWTSYIVSTSNISHLSKNEKKFTIDVFRLLQYRMDIYTIMVISSFLDHDSKLICNRINNTLRKIVGDVKWYINYRNYSTTELVKESRISLDGRYRINAFCGFYGSNRLYTYLTRRTQRNDEKTRCKDRQTPP